MWIVLSLLTALAAATQDAWIKKKFSQCGIYEMVSIPLFFSLPLILATVPFLQCPPLDRVFFWTLIVGLPIEALSFLLYIWAIRISPLSLTLPYLAFTPAFMLITGRWLLGERPNIWGIGGIAITVIGAYVLNLEPGANRFTAPLKAFAMEPGSRIMLLVSLLYSFTAAIGKLGILHSSVMFFSMTYFGLFNLSLLLPLLVLRKISLSRLMQKPGDGLVAGILVYMHIVLHGWAVVLVKAAYMISVKRLSILFGVVYGAVLFEERNIRNRFAGAVLMAGGAALIIIKGR